MAQAKHEACNKLYDLLETKEGEKQAYKIMKNRQRKGQDLGKFRYINSGDDKLLIAPNDIKKRWKTYYEKLVNEENPRDEIAEIDPVPGVIELVTEQEVDDALHKMKFRKATGPDGVCVDAWKLAGKVGVKVLATLFNKILDTQTMPSDWRKSSVVTIFKNKGSILECDNYRGIKLLSHTFKIWERILDTRIRQCTTISARQFGFMPGRSTMDAVHGLRTLMEKHRDKKKELHMVFVDLEKAYDRVPRDLIWWAMRRKGVPEAYVSAVRDTYEGASTHVRTMCGETDVFNVKVGVHQGSVLSPYLFIMILDEISAGIPGDAPWTMLFADDLVFASSSRIEVEKTLEKWRVALKMRA